MMEPLFFAIFMAPVWPKECISISFLAPLPPPINLMGRVFLDIHNHEPEIVLSVQIA